jgi:hypothetical protein
VSEVSLNADQAAALRTAEPGTRLVADDGTPVGLFVPQRMADEIRKHLDDRRRRYEQALAMAPDDDELTPEAKAAGIPHDEVMKRLGLG